MCADEVVCYIAERHHTTPREVVADFFDEEETAADGADGSEVPVRLATGAYGGRHPQSPSDHGTCCHAALETNERAILRDLATLLSSSRGCSDGAD